LKTKGLYTVIEKEIMHENAISITVQIHASHNIFDGHFPKHPVLPGVTLLQITKELIEDHIQKAVVLQRVNRIKYLNLVDPNEQDRMVLYLQLEDQGATIKVKNNSTFVDGTPVMNGLLVFSKK
jgi:3-hydroxyacyl-[acyl-carrier-protein] dehydratase